MTNEEKARIDAMTYQQLLSGWRFAAVGDTRFQGEHGRYWGERMAKLKGREPDGGVGASKRLGW